MFKYICENAKIQNKKSNKKAPVGLIEMCNHIVPKVSKVFISDRIDHINFARSGIFCSLNSCL